MNHKIQYIKYNQTAKVLHSTCQQIWKLSSDHRTGKGQFSFQSQGRTMPKNVQITTQLYSFHMLARSWLKSFKLGFNSRLTENFAMYKLDLERQRNQTSICQHPLDHRKNKGIPGKKKNLLLLHWLHQSLWLCGSQQTVENSSRDGTTRPPYLPQEKPVCRSWSKSCNWHGTMDWFQIMKGVH